MTLADIQVDVLGRSLLIALVLVTPYAIIKMRQVRAVRQERLELELAAAAPPAEDRGPALEDVIAQISSSSSGTLLVPHQLTIDGDPAPPELVDALVRDAMRRSRLVATAEVDTADGRVIEFESTTRET